MIICIKLPPLRSLFPFEDSGNSSSAQGSTPSLRPRPHLRPHTSPCVVAAREDANPKKRPLDEAEYGELLIDEFATGSSSASKARSFKQNFGVQHARNKIATQPL